MRHELRRHAVPRHSGGSFTFLVAKEARFGPTHDSRFQPEWQPVLLPSKPRLGPRMQGEAFGIPPREAAVVVAVGQAAPALVLLAGDVRLARLALGVQRVELLLQAFLSTFLRTFWSVELLTEQLPFSGLLDMVLGIAPARCAARHPKQAVPLRQRPGRLAVASANGRSIHASASSARWMRRAGRASRRSRSAAPPCLPRGS